MKIEEALALKENDPSWMESFKQSDIEARVKMLREIGVSEEYIPSKKQMDEAELDAVSGGTPQWRWIYSGYDD